MSGEDEKKKGFLDVPATGIPVFVLIVAEVYALVLVLGTWLGGHIKWFLEYVFFMPFLYFFQGLPGIMAVTLEYLMWGVAAFLVLVLPYLLVYYLAVSVLLDTGYMKRVNTMFQELSSGTRYTCLAVVPFVLGLGCTISGLQSLEYAPDRRFRVLTAPLLMAAPCSAKAIIVIGLVLRYAGVVPALLVLLIDLLVVGLGVFLLARFARPPEAPAVVQPGKIKPPSLRGTRKWFEWHMRGFTRVGFPAIVVGSVIAGLLRYSGLLVWLGDALDPVAGFLFGFSGLALVFLFVGLLRKELGIELYALVAGFSLSAIMAPQEIFVFGLMSTLLVPCWAVMIMLFKLFKPKEAGIMLGVSAGLTAVAGVVAHIVISLVGW